MNEAGIAEARTRGRSRFGCLARIVLAIVAGIALIIVIGETFDQGDSAKPPSSNVDAGPAENYLRGDLSALAVEPVWIVRLEDGEFIALYNKSPKQQEQRTGCRVRFDESAQLIGPPQLPGFSGAFVEECDGLRATWRADGKFAGGAGYGDLDRFETSTDGAGHLIVETGRRTCTKSRGVAGLPPYDVRTCTGRPQ